MMTRRETVVEVRLLDEDDLKAFAAGGLDPPIMEAIEAYLFHHPEAAGRVEAYRRAAQHVTKAPVFQLRRTRH